MMEVMKMLETLKEMWNKGRILKERKVRMFENTCLLSIVHGCETWMMNAGMRKKE